MSSANLVTEQSSSVSCHLLLTLTNDYASNGASLLDVPGLLCKHALTPLEQSDVTLDVLGVNDLTAAAVGLGYSDKAPHLHRRGGKEAKLQKEQRPTLTARISELCEQALVSPSVILKRKRERLAYKKTTEGPFSDHL